MLTLLFFSDSPPPADRYMIRIMSDDAPPFEKELPASAMTERVLPARAVLFRQDAPCIGFFRLLTGAVDMVRWTPSGASLRLHAVKPGETFAEASLFAGRYHCDAVATAESTLRCYARQPVLESMEISPKLAAGLAEHLATSLRDARRLLELRAVTPLKYRLLLRLQDLADRDGTVPASVTVAGIAAEIGATPEACYRAVADLQTDRQLKRPGRGKITLTARP